MSIESENHKRTFRLGRTKITTHISENDPVFMGVMHAAEIEGGQFPEHVGHIKIKPDIVASAKKGYFVCGNCRQTERGGSEVQIFAGSIKEVVDTPLIDLRTTRVALHEFGHSLRAMETQIGAWLHENPSEAWEEEYAEKYVIEKYTNYRKRNSQDKPKTWREILELRKQEQKSVQP